MAVPGVTSGAMRETSVSSSCSGSGSCVGIEVVLEDHLRGDRMGERLVFAAPAADVAQPRFSVRGGQAFVDKRDGQAETRLERACEVGGLLRERMGLAVHGERQP